MLKKINLMFITVFNIGKIKYAPGTFGSIFACLLFFILHNFLSFIYIFVFVLLIFLYSLISISGSADSFSNDDPKEIVIDEVVGQFLPLLAIPIYENLYLAPTIYYILFSFILFRFFDILKPFPINYIDENVDGALWIMSDDIFAGIYSVIILVLLFYFIGA